MRSSICSVVVAEPVASGRASYSGRMSIYVDIRPVYVDVRRYNRFYVEFGHNAICFLIMKCQISENKNFLKISKSQKKKSKKSRQKSPKIYFSQMFFGDEDDGLLETPSIKKSR